MKSMQTCAPKWFKWGWRLSNLVIACTLAHKSRQSVETYHGLQKHLLEEKGTSSDLKICGVKAATYKHSIFEPESINHLERGSSSFYFGHNAAHERSMSLITKRIFSAPAESMPFCFSFVYEFLYASKCSVVSLSESNARQEVPPPL